MNGVKRLKYYDYRQQKSRPILPQRISRISVATAWRCWVPGRKGPACFLVGIVSVFLVVFCIMYGYQAVGWLPWALSLALWLVARSGRDSTQSTLT